MALYNSCFPIPLLAWARMTGMPSARERASASTRIPRFAATSIMFSTARVGRRISRSCRQRYRLFSSVEASSTATICAGSSSTMNCRAAISSGDQEARLYVPGRSTSSTRVSPHTKLPAFFSTVTPG